MQPIITYHATTFNGTALSSVPGLTVLACDVYRPAHREVSLAKLARVDSRRINSTFFDSRTITIAVGIRATSRPLLESALDTLHQMLTAVESNLVVTQGITPAQAPTFRRYTATWVDSKVKVDGGSYYETDLVFECSDSFGYEVSPTTLVSASGITAATRTDNFTIRGSARWQVPIITITYAALTGGTGKNVTIGNPSNGQQIVVNRTWSINDILVVNAFDKTVRVNGSLVAFSGAIPEWTIGSGSWSYTDDITSRTFTASLVYSPRFI